MKFCAILLGLSLTFSAWATWVEEARKLLPGELQQFKSGVTTLKDVEARLGKAALVKGAKRYWVYQGFEYALELEFKADKLAGIHFTFPQQGPELGKIAKEIKLTSFHPAKEAPKKFLRFEDKSGALTIDMASQTVHSVRLP